jgi:hypothetical protein
VVVIDGQVVIAPLPTVSTVGTADSAVEEIPIPAIIDIATVKDFSVFVFMIRFSCR